jgi:hypothetical protein
VPSGFGGDRRDPHLRDIRGTRVRAQRSSMALGTGPSNFDNCDIGWRSSDSYEKEHGTRPEYSSRKMIVS